MKNPFSSRSLVPIRLDPDPDRGQPTAASTPCDSPRSSNTRAGARPIWRTIAADTRQRRGGRGTPAGIPDHGTDRPRTEGRRRRPELVRRDDPPENDPRPRPSEGVGRQPDGRRHRRDPVEPVEDDESGQAPRCIIEAEGQVDQ